VRWLRMTTVAALAACGPATTQTTSDLDAPPQPPPSIEATGNGYLIRLQRDQGVAVSTIEGGRSEVFQALVTAFEEFALPVEGIDATRGILQTGSFRAVRRLGEHRLSQLFQCGATLTGDRADTWRLEIEVDAQVQQDGEGSRLTTRVSAFARPTDGTSTNGVPCVSMGRLEQMITERIADRVA